MSTKTKSQTTSAAHQRKHIRHDLSWQERREIAYEIFDRISHGEMLRDICSEEGMPHPNTLRNWAYLDKPLAFFYTCAQKLRLDGLLEELMALTDLPAPTCKDARGNVRIDNAGVAFMKHRFEAKKWIFTILQRDPNWVDYGQRDPALNQYPEVRPLSVPPTPAPPVHKISEQPAFVSGQPEAAAAEETGKISEQPADTEETLAPGTTNSAPKPHDSAANTGTESGKCQGAAMASSPSLPPPQAHLPNDTQPIDPEQKGQNSDPSQSQSPVHKNSEPSVDSADSGVAEQLNPKLETPNPKPSSPPTRSTAQPNLAPETLNMSPAATPSPVHKISEPSVGSEERTNVDAFNPKPSASPTSGRSLRFRNR